MSEGLRIENYNWYSERCGREMFVKRVGHWGPSLVYFPTCGGDSNEFFRYGLMEDARHWLENGRMQIFTVDSLNMETWYNGGLELYHRARWAEGYNQYILQEVLPFVRQMAHNPFVGLMGCSFGAYTVTNLLFKRPDLVNLAVAMSGVFGVDDLVEPGVSSDELYFNNPPWYLRDVSDPDFYARFRSGSSRLWMLCGEHDICKPQNEDFHALLEWKGIPHWYDRWDPPCDHHEYWWKQMIQQVLGRLY